MDTENKFYTDFLFSTNSFLIGAGSAINLGGNYYEFNTSDDGEADSRAIRSDFCMVGQDMKEAKQKFDEENLEYSF